MRIIAKEVRPTDVVGDSIDLLALDGDGNLVIIELKRGSQKLHLLQAISYVGMAAKWTALQIRAEAKKFNRSEMIDDLDDENLNQGQRILSVAEEYDYEVLVAAEWLYARDVELDCVRVALAVDGNSKYLTFTQIFPTPELAEQSRKRRTRGSAIPMYASWPDALSPILNKAVADFFTKELAADRENGLLYREVYFRQGNKRRFTVRLRPDYAYVEQAGRFADDLNYWQERLSGKDSIRSINRMGQKDDCLRFRLSTNEDFAAFNNAVNDQLKAVHWASTGASVQAASA